MRPHPTKLLATALALLALALAWLYFAPVELGGSTTYVLTDGVSMEPRFHAGDLVLLRQQASYRVGEIVAYRSTSLHTVVLHRIVGEAGGRYLFKGDHNNFTDIEHPTRSQLLGALWLHIPGLSGRLDSLRSPVLLGVLLGLATLLLAGAALTGRRRARHDRGQARARRSPGYLRPATAAVALALLALLSAVALAAIAFTRPTGALLPSRLAYRQTGRLSYTANAQTGPAYPAGRAVTGEPLFTHVLDRVHLSYAYAFHTAATSHSLRGRASLYAQVSSTSGWRTALPLGPQLSFRGDRARLDATLDLGALRRLLHTLETTTGVGGSYTLAIVPHVSISGRLRSRAFHAVFSPPTRFSLNQFEIEPVTADGPLSGERSSRDPFAASRTGTLQEIRYEPLFITLGSARTSVATARTLSASAIAILAGILAALLARARSRPPDEHAAIHARYGSLIVPVERVWHVPELPVVDVLDIDDLARIAEHYDRSILHETAEQEDAFWVADESGLYRYTLLPEHAWTADDELDEPEEASRLEQPDLGFDARHTLDLGRYGAPATY
jgi:signal peptidase I